jgi:hypothetical protein
MIGVGLGQNFWSILVLLCLAKNVKLSASLPFDRLNKKIGFVVFQLIV